jgi:hypothetical protein
MRDDDPGEPQHGLPRIGIDEGEEPLLSALARGRLVLEIGTGLGYSTRALARTARLVVTVDPDEWVEKNIVPTLPLNVAFRRELSGPVPVDLVFVDGDHRPDAVRRDTLLAVQCVCDGGLVVFHDWTGLDDVAGSVRSVVGGAAPLYAIPTKYGLGVLVVTSDVIACIARGGR